MNWEWMPEEENEETNLPSEPENGDAEEAAEEKSEDPSKTVKGDIQELIEKAKKKALLPTARF